MRSERIYAAVFNDTSIGTAAQPIMTLEVPDNTIIEVLEAWLSPAIGTPVDEVISISYFGNDVVSSGGTTPTPQPLSPAAAADVSNVTFRLEGTIGATPLDLWPDAYHLQNGWRLAQIPEAMSVFIGGNASPGDNVGLRLVTATTATPTISGGMIYREISAA